ncbi:MAG: GAF domain-containing protein [Candidatus Marinimicrobia bacterium]|nr:GAF domain-containing protein [Candidatus Neomarinimicrobiota bacterium]
MTTESNMLDTLMELAQNTQTTDAFSEKAVQIIQDSNSKYDWVGIYIALEERLHLPPTYFKGLDPEHKDIPYTEGICGAAASQNETIVIDDVNAEPRYLACSIYTKSEIVVPLTYNKQLLGVLDLDSHTPAAFGEQEQTELEAAAKIIGEYYYKQTNK